MKKHGNSYLEYVYILWAATLIMAVVVTLITPRTDLSRNYDMQIEASTLTQIAFDAIKNKKIELGIPLSEDDINETGLLGESYTGITTTLGTLESKRTSLNPNFAALYIKMFDDAGLKRGDQVGVVFSGSFPGLNIAAMCAIEVYGLEPCVMSSIGSSSYGANNTSFTYYDMHKYLLDQKIISNKIDYLSFGGSYDIGFEFDEADKENIRSRVDEDTIFIYNDNYVENLKYRMEAFSSNIPKMKLLINVGGNLISMGKDEYSFIYSNGLIKPNYLTINSYTDMSKVGLIDRYLQLNMPVIHMLNLKSLANKYGIEYDPSPIPEIGVGEVYYEKNYSILIPVIALMLSVVLTIFCYSSNKKRKESIKYEK